MPGENQNFLFYLLSFYYLHQQMSREHEIQFVYRGFHDHILHYTNEIIIQYIGNQ